MIKRRRCNSNNNNGSSSSSSSNSTSSFSSNIILIYDNLCITSATISFVCNIAKYLQKIMRAMRPSSKSVHALMRAMQQHVFEQSNTENQFAMSCYILSFLDQL
uniref:Uncharacterized protein n=1 Tax=Glossina pallidipes TaxID=7398 RepID=A0A1A9ZMC3_GLOPL